MHLSLLLSVPIFAVAVAVDSVTIAVVGTVFHHHLGEASAPIFAAVVVEDSTTMTAAAGVVPTKAEASPPARTGVRVSVMIDVAADVILPVVATIVRHFAIIVAFVSMSAVDSVIVKPNPLSRLLQ
jgi:hypothetical protein